jgi:hypothetical protein
MRQGFSGSQIIIRRIPGLYVDFLLLHKNRYYNNYAVCYKVDERQVITKERGG